MALRSVVVIGSLVTTAALALHGPAPVSAASPVARGLARVEAIAAARAGEVARIQRHFDSVLVELRAADTHALGPARRAARARQIARLAAYRDRGIFPLNEHFPDSVLPYFVDRAGTRCAVAHLMFLDGREPIVRRVTSRRNNAWVAELRDEPGLAAWLDEAGLTLEEAARIQVPYVGEPAPSPEVTPSGRVGTPYAAASAVAALASGASIAYMLRAESPRRAYTVAGVAVGATGIALGAARIGERGNARALGAANAFLGSAAAAFAIRSLFRDETSESAAARRERAVAFTPTVGREVGFTVAARF